MKQTRENITMSLQLPFLVVETRWGGGRDLKKKRGIKKRSRKRGNPKKEKEGRSGKRGGWRGELLGVQAAVNSDHQEGLP